MSFEPDQVIKRTKGRMVMLYAIRGATEEHMASFFHEDKALYVLGLIEEDGVDVLDEDAKPKKKAKKKVKRK